MPPASKGHLAVGISGWTYSPWRSVFFPKGWPQKRELEYASRQVNSIEINGTFYSLHVPKSYQAWYDATPEHFIFSVKAPRFITHIKRLEDVGTPVANFLASGILCLKEKLGPILWQLPPSFTYDHDKMETFLGLLPHDTEEAVRVSQRHDDNLRAKAWSQTDAQRPLRHAMEVRNKSFVCEEFINQLRKHKVALVIADTAGKWPFMEDVTSDFIYIRLHGDEKLYVRGYTEKALKEWQRKIQGWIKGSIPKDSKLTVSRAKADKDGRDVFIYFDNDVKVRAPYDAMTLAHNLGIGQEPPDMPDDVQSQSEEPRRKWPAVAPQHWAKGSQG